MDKTPPFDDSQPLRDTPQDPRDVSRRSPPAGNPAGSGQNPASPRRSLHVLCIDDDEQVLASLKDCLAYFGHRVEAASGGKHGIDMFCTAVLKSEPYDVVITDWNMPDVDGYEVARQIKAESPATPVIIMSGLGANLKGTGSIAALVDAVVNKPPRMRELNDLLLRLARKA